MKNPTTASWDLNISDADFAKLKRGVRPRDMDDKWTFQAITDEEFEEATTGEVLRDGITTEEPITDYDLTTDDLLMEEETTDEPTVDLDQSGNISIIRSWLNKELYRLLVKPSEGRTSAKIEAITWEQSQGYSQSISETQAKMDAILLCRQILECDLAAAPDYDP